MCSVFYVTNCKKGNMHVFKYLKIYTQINILLFNCICYYRCRLKNILNLKKNLMRSG